MNAKSLTSEHDNSLWLYMSFSPMIKGVTHLAIISRLY
jgi:hypothetical protein